MQVLIAEDERVSRTILKHDLEVWGHELVVVDDGLEAWRILEAHNAPKLAILDWMMPGLDGVEICRRVRALDRAEPTYLMLLTSRHRKEDIATGLDGGANDYVVKPFDRRELHARVRVAERVVELQSSLAMRIRELERALAAVKQLQGLLPICCHCKRPRQEGHYWRQLEAYLALTDELQDSAGICPGCPDTTIAEVESMLPTQALLTAAN